MKNCTRKPRLIGEQGWDWISAFAGGACLATFFAAVFVVFGGPMP